MFMCNLDQSFLLFSPFPQLYFLVFFCFLVDMMEFCEICVLLLHFIFWLYAENMGLKSHRFDHLSILIMLIIPDISQV